MAEIKQLLRPDMLVFMNTGTTAAPKFNLIGMGVEEQMLSYNPKVDTKQYIHQLNANTSVTGYEAQLNAPTEGWAGVPVFDFVDELAMKFAVGSDLNTDVLIVYPYKAFKATKHAATVIINEKGGSGGEALMLNYDISLNGDPIEGTATVDKVAETATFTAATGE
ncbi:hypothetical protein G7062_11270 [Erysipelothrix sp. HDW6C]|uniref:hypothetical protein n=1 Tax=Erysipelothrix sp. HDW6C TaxID=2714930 RepID=UPI00140C321A|nr:hypothetical protein [Erysipelothrix sp. HDW6C]QIK70838.1 hypothetical protein G7062_11270 [Erysipelothrix sp. HDW6C]